jgi:hypothetical protein
MSTFKIDILLKRCRYHIINPPAATRIFQYFKCLVQFIYTCYYHHRMSSVRGRTITTNKNASLILKSRQGCLFDLRSWLILWHDHCSFMKWSNLWHVQGSVFDLIQPLTCPGICVWSDRTSCMSMGLCMIWSNLWHVQGSMNA